MPANYVFRRNVPFWKDICVQTGKKIKKNPVCREITLQTGDSKKNTSQTEKIPAPNRNYALIVRQFW